MVCAALQRGDGALPHRHREALAHAPGPPSSWGAGCASRGTRIAPLGGAQALATRCCSQVEASQKAHVLLSAGSTATLGVAAAATSGQGTGSGVSTAAPGSLALLRQALSRCEQQRPSASYTERHDTSSSRCVRPVACAAPPRPAPACGGSLPWGCSRTAWPTACCSGRPCSSATCWRQAGAHPARSRGVKQLAHKRQRATHHSAPPSSRHCCRRAQQGTVVHAALGHGRSLMAQVTHAAASNATALTLAGSGGREAEAHLGGGAHDDGEAHARSAVLLSSLPFACAAVLTVLLARSSQVRVLLVQGCSNSRKQTLPRAAHGPPRRVRMDLSAGQARVCHAPGRAVPLGGQRAHGALLRAPASCQQHGGPGAGVWPAGGGARLRAGAALGW